MPNTKKVRSRIEGQFQRAEGEQQKIPFLDIGGDEEVEGLRLVDEWGAVARQFQYPALVDLETGLEDVLFLLGQELEMLDRAALLQDGVTRLLAVLGLGDQQLFQLGVADDEAARQRLVRLNVGGDRLDAGGSAAARAEEHTSELQSLMRRSSAVFC